MFLCRVSIYLFILLCTTSAFKTCTDVNQQQYQEIYDSLKHSKNFTLHLDISAISELRNNSKNSSTYMLKIENGVGKLPYLQIGIDMRSEFRDTKLQLSIYIGYRGKDSYESVMVNHTIEDQIGEEMIIKVNSSHIGIFIDCGWEHYLELRQPPKGLDKNSETKVRVCGQDATMDLKNETRGTVMTFYPTWLIGLPWKFVLLVLNAIYLGSKDADLLDAENIFQVHKRKLDELIQVVATLSKQNAKLTERVDALETCHCIPQCSENGTIFSEGTSWTKNRCTHCTCQNKLSVCYTNQSDPTCFDPCTLNPCSHGGTCVPTHPRHTNSSWYTCHCSPTYTGRHCEHHFIEPPSDRTTPCNESRPKFFFNAVEMECFPTLHTGCSQNSQQYNTMEECVRRNKQGACCYTDYALSLKLANNTDSENITCQVMDIKDCKQLHRKMGLTSRQEVISFTANSSCDMVQCAAPRSGCTVDGVTVRVGATIKRGCTECRCGHDQFIECKCVQLSKRKEIREMTHDEVIQFQRAVSHLNNHGDWRSIRAIYHNHIMHSSGGPFFLPWNRLFLRHVEYRLQKFDCNVVLPYFDFTTDSSNFTDSIIFQPDLFGGDGEGVDNCVPDHPFGDRETWKPCIKRNFSQHRLPSLIELLRAVKTENYTEMSRTLESSITYVHEYIGGDMASASAAYDPIFLPLHAYVDMLYWEWQAVSSNKYKYPAVFGNVPLKPFNVPTRHILDLESSLCVTYLPIGQGHLSREPCHMTETLSYSDTPYNWTQWSESAYDYFGYDRYGYDRRGYNAKGFNRDGFNRDGYDKDAYDRDGYNRYGFDRYGYDNKGFNASGYNKHGFLDSSQRFSGSMRSFKRNGLLPSGVDRYGFTTVSGVNSNSCIPMYTVSFNAILSRRMWIILMKQPRNFLDTFRSICGDLPFHSLEYKQQTWDMKYSTPANFTANASMTRNSNRSTTLASRMCFNHTDLNIHITCAGDIATCPKNLCHGQSCDPYPEAVCRIDMCGNCTSAWIQDGVKVNCEHDRDYCWPNPCNNGGKCVPSTYSLYPQYISCVCPPGADGHLCQYLAKDVCELPVTVGPCSNHTTRWYFNHHTASCDIFTYSGCHGNANNFATYSACRNACVIGACCYREPKLLNYTIGYNKRGFDRYGFNKKGRYDNSSSFSGLVYDMHGYDPYGYNSSGYDRNGFNLTGFSKTQEYDGKFEYDENGYDMDGYNRAGFNCRGEDREGFDYYRLSRAFVYNCRQVTRRECRRLQTERNVNIVSFDAGKNCSSIVTCTEKCHCKNRDGTFSLGEKFHDGCSECECTKGGKIECSCTAVQTRNDVRELTASQLRRFHRIVKELSKGNDSAWYGFAKLYASHKASASGAMFLPFNRAFLKHVERGIQNKFDCTFTIPYYDWSTHIADQLKSPVWAANVFGGNGHPVTHCVRYHPFKPAYPRYLTPCLRRRFDQSVHLPDIVDIAIVLKQENFSEFSKQIQSASRLFRQFVGGHMLMDLSAYDPLFYSHIAYLDKLWDDWQFSHQRTPVSFPKDQQYTPLFPFPHTPDDVFNLTQLCIDYASLGEGIPCDALPVKFPVDDEQYDIHGFDVYGYDRDGFNADGFDKNGIRDTRGVFDDEGYDSEGFKRDGYDSMGFDRFFFQKSGFNSDGYNPYGYSSHGYNKLGSRPGKQHVERMTASSRRFDQQGYDRLGYDKFGYDYEDYDIYGYNSSGYDRKGCSHYSNGPFYHIIHKDLMKQLSNMSTKQLLQLPRLCGELSEVATWLRLRDWNIDPDDILSPEQTGFMQQPAPFFNRTVAKWNDTFDDDFFLWLPSSLEDRRLCVPTNYFTECAIGQQVMNCSMDLCANLTCASDPRAQCVTTRCDQCLPQWYNVIDRQAVQCTGCIDENGDVKKEDDEWERQECEWCRCQAGQIKCKGMKCDEPSCSHPVKLPGVCCPDCDGACDYEGMVYRNASTFASPTDPCIICNCTRSSVRCNPVECREPPNDCKTVAVVNGECCPSCLDCGRHDNGTEWAADTCTVCTCVNGLENCTRQECPVVNCSHPVTVDGECCPLCSGCIKDGIAYGDGDTWVPTNSPCEQCRCRNGHVNCKTLVPCTSSCTHGVFREFSCCSDCSDCLFEGRVIPNLRIFTKSDNNCRKCQCNHGNVVCSEIELCPATNCTVTEILQGACCPICKGCHEGGRFFHHNELMHSKHPCIDCHCVEGEKLCEPKPCRPVECDHPRTIDDGCCPVCSGCNYGNWTYEHDETFVPPGNPCYKCTCESGHVECVKSLEVCDTRCSHPARVDGQCCKVCDNCEFEKRAFKNGQEFRPPGGSVCESCVCKNGSVTCSDTECPPLACLGAVHSEDECCDRCPYTCLLANVILEHGTTVTDPTDKCRQCSCNDGKIECQTKPCETLRCTHPAKLTSACCETCDICLFYESLYYDGQLFVHPRNKCRKCQCEEGSVVCRPVSCPATDCPSPTILPGHCCPVCQCQFLGITYRADEQFDHPTDKCQECVCRKNQIFCHSRSCPAVSCTNPVKGDCCLECKDCDLTGVIVTNGSTVQHNKLPCRECSCFNGSIKCQRKACPEAPCTHPALSKCCLDCIDCFYDNKRYKNFAKFKDTQRECHDCSCLNGNIKCSPKTCKNTAQCSHPFQGVCCMQCDKCSYNSNVYENGTTFDDPLNECQQCKCSLGNVDCTNKSCPPTICHYPMKGKCCPECNDCFYHGKVIRNGSYLKELKVACRTCVCLNGNINCQLKKCAPVKCKHPIKKDCCARCTACSFGKKHYENGAVFEKTGNSCVLCRCTNGNVRCFKKICPKVGCSHPIKRNCCPKCSGCRYGNRNYQSGNQFIDKSRPCFTCVCDSGNVVCSQKCPIINCTHPVQGKCCQECNGCNYYGHIYGNKEHVPASVMCQDCVCSDGNVTCVPRSCKPTTCLHPVKTKCCPVCKDCNHRGIVWKNGKSFPHWSDVCKVCMCKGGTVTCKKKASCPAVTCTHPVAGLCCLDCSSKCLYNKIVMNHNEVKTYRCMKCKCQFGSVTCTPITCPKLTCTHPVKPARSCCQSCSGPCLFRGVILKHEESKKENCETCTCHFGTVKCDTVPCPKLPCKMTVKQANTCCPVCSQTCTFKRHILKHGQSMMDYVKCRSCLCNYGSVSCRPIKCPPIFCSHPVKLPGSCCYGCTSCYFNGLHIQNGDVAVKGCDRCTCRNGNVTCTNRECAAVCSHPVSMHECCPVCVDCLVFDVIYSHGAQFTSIQDPCQQCVCENGNVTCTRQTCPVLNCPHKTRPINECCEQCQGCVLDGQTHDEGSQWALSTNVCVACQCHFGVITCDGIQCINHCVSPVIVTDRCCPVCDSCMYGGVSYRNGESFTPTGDPCDVCTCQDARVECHRDTCINTYLCTPGRLIPASQGECCPTCVHYRDECGHTADIGKVVHPKKQDPCLTCECMSADKWVCRRRLCPPLKCPINVQFTVDGDCCAHCPECYSKKTKSYHRQGERWSDPKNPCVSCLCATSRILCSYIECAGFACPEGYKLTVTPDTCCGQCIKLREDTCFHNSVERQAGDSWQPDECTFCECTSGLTQCSVTRCPPLVCEGDTELGNIPGDCCPTCQPKSRICTVYGGGHYKTFTGHSLHFLATCAITMATDCLSKDFAVEVHHTIHANRNTSKPANMTVRMLRYNTTVVLSNESHVTVNGKLVNLPLFLRPYLYVERSDQTIYLTSLSGIKVLWDGNRGDVSVPSTYPNKTCGLCGGLNDSHVDLTKPNGNVTNSSVAFVNSWKVKDSPCEVDAREPPSCWKGSSVSTATKDALEKCLIIKSSLFARCHPIVSPDSYFTSCLHDACVCSLDTDCTCDVIAAYAHDCARHDTVVDWRTHQFCPWSRECTGGRVYGACASVCVATCENPDVRRACHKPCTEGCECGASGVLRNGECIDAHLCTSP